MGHGIFDQNRSDYTFKHKQCLPTLKSSQWSTNQSKNSRGYSLTLTPKPGRKIKGLIDNHSMAEIASFMQRKTEQAAEKGTEESTSPKNRQQEEEPPPWQPSSRRRFEALQEASYQPEWKQTDGQRQVEHAPCATREVRQADQRLHAQAQSQNSHYCWMQGHQ